MIQDSSATTDKAYSYTPYGQASLIDSLPSLSNHFTYTGREEDNGVTGLLYYRARYYSNLQQRFISEDPIGLQGGINQYAYTEEAPIDENDPFGLMGSGMGGLYKPPPPNKKCIKEILSRAFGPKGAWVITEFSIFSFLPVNEDLNDSYDDGIRDDAGGVTLKVAAHTTGTILGRASEHIGAGPALLSILGVGSIEFFAEFIATPVTLWATAVNGGIASEVQYHPCECKK